MNQSESVLNKLKELINFSNENSQFYKNRFKENNLDIQSLSFESYSHIPVLNKKEIINKESSLLTSTYGLTEEMTSGSTGNPLHCYKGTPEVLIKTRKLWEYRRENGGITPKDKYAMFYAFTENDLKADKVQFVDNIIYLSMLNMSAHRLQEYYDVLMENKPSWILGVPSALYVFSLFILDNNLPTSSLEIKYIEANGEVLFDYQKQAIEKAFGKILYNHYGSREFWCLAMSCNKGAMHMNTEHFYFEVINKNRNGIGDLVITDLKNKTWPLIRYKIGDLVHGEVDRCDCGEKSPVLNITGGRSQEYLVIDDWIANPILFHYGVIKVNRLYGDVIRQFRVTQLLEYVLEMEIVAGNNFTEEIKFVLREEILSKVPKSITFSIKKKNSIKNTNNKFKYFIPYKKEVK